MAKRLLFTLTACILVLLSIQAQTPFTGKVIYKMDVGQKKEAPTEFIANYNKFYILLQAMIPEKTGEIAGKSLAIDFITNHAYDISHKSKTIIKRFYAEGKTDQIQLADTPIQRGKIAGLSATAYRATLSDGTHYTIWMADSLPLAVPASLKKSNDLFIWAMNRLMLRITAHSGIKGFRSPFMIEARFVMPELPTDSTIKLPQHYTITDQVNMAKMQDSLLREFKKVDSQLRVNGLQLDSALMGKSLLKPKQPAKRPKSNGAKKGKPALLPKEGTPLKK